MASVERYVSSHNRLINTFINANTHSFRIRDYAEVKRNMAALDFGTNDNYVAIIDSDGEYILSNYGNARQAFNLIKEWESKSNLHGTYKGNLFDLSNGSYFIFQYPIRDGESSRYLGTFFSFVSDRVFKDQEYVAKKKLILVGAVLLLIQTLVIFLVSSAIVAPIESFVKKWLKGKDVSQISKQIVVDDEPYTKDIIKMSEAMAQLMSKQAIDVAVGRLSHQIAHDMRGPLATIQGYIQTDDNDLDEEDKRLFLDSAMRCTRRLNDMAEELLDYAKVGNIERQIVDLARLIKNIIADAKLAVSDGKIIFNYQGPDHLSVYIDGSKMTRVLANMLSNAMQAITDKGEIKFSIDKTSDENLLIKLKDTGRGISSEHIPLIFDSTFTFGKKKGTGLGLAYCENVINAHGGNVEVRSQLGKGSEFYITIPMHEK